MKNDIFIENFVTISAGSEPMNFQGKKVFDLLGLSLTQLLEELLDDLKVQDEPDLNAAEFPQTTIRGRVYIAPGAVVEPTAFIQGPAYIGSQAQIRHGAYVRGSTYVASHAVVGHATEVKGSVFFPHAKAGHFAYVGDSLLGNHVNLGAGTKLANLKFTGKQVRVRLADGTLVNSGLRKLGAILGDHVQTGCNVVLSPGTILYPGTAVSPCAHFHGTLTSGIIGSPVLPGQTHKAGKSPSK